MQAIDIPIFLKQLFWNQESIKELVWTVIAFFLGVLFSLRDERKQQRFWFGRILLSEFRDFRKFIYEPVKERPRVKTNAIADLDQVIQSREEGLLSDSQERHLQEFVLRLNEYERDFGGNRRIHAKEVIAWKDLTNTFLALLESLDKRFRKRLSSERSFLSSLRQEADGESDPRDVQFNVPE